MIYESVSEVGRRETLELSESTNFCRVVNSDDGAGLIMDDIPLTKQKEVPESSNNIWSC